MRYPAARFACLLSFRLTLSSVVESSDPETDREPIQ